MKNQFLLVVVLCVVVKGQHYGYEGRGDYVPVIKDGVPIDTPEVQAAKAAHFEAYERARVLAEKSPSGGQYEKSVGAVYQQQYQPQQIGYQRQQYHPQSYQQQQHYQPQYQSNVLSTQARQHYSVGAYSSAIPSDTPEVQQARTAHLAAFSQAAQTNHYRYRRGLYHYQPEPHYQPLPQPPEDTPEVQLAKYQHLVAHASAHEEDVDDYYPAPHDDYFHIPIITKKGVPVNTASVKAARQQHQLAHKLAHTGAQISGGHSVHEPVIAPNGVPFDTPEVYIAKVQHLAAHAQESTKHNQWGLHSGYGSHGF